MRRQIVNGRGQMNRNRPWDVVTGDLFRVRIWRNDLGKGRSELKADLYRNADGSHTGSLFEEELIDLHRSLGKALKKMHRYRVRQLWRQFLFPW